MDPLRKRQSKPHGVTEEELLEYTAIQEKVLYKLRKQFRNETEYPYSIVESKADRLLRECKLDSMRELGPIIPQTKTSKARLAKAKQLTKATQSNPQRGNNENFGRRAQSFPRNWKDVILPIGSSRRSPSTEVNLPKSSRTSVTTFESLPSEVSSGFYDQYSVNKYWQDGVYQKSIQPHFIFEKHLASNPETKKSIVSNKKLVRPWPKTSTVTQDSVFKSRPRSPLHITQPGKADCSAFSSIESRDKFLASLSACPIISCSEEEDSSGSSDVLKINLENADENLISASPSKSAPQIQISSHLFRDLNQNETDIIIKDVQSSPNLLPDLNDNFVENRSTEEIVVNNLPEINVKVEPEIQNQPSPVVLTLALIPLPWRAPLEVVEVDVEEQVDLDTTQVSEFVNPEPVPVVPVQESEPKAIENKNEEEVEVKPLTRKARSVCSIVHATGSETAVKEKLTLNQSRLMLEIEQILSRRTSKNFASTQSSQTELTTASELLEEHKIRQSMLTRQDNNGKVLLPAEKQMLTRLSGIFRRFDYENSKNVINPKLKTPSKLKTSVKWPEYKFDISLFPKADSLIAQAKELVNGNDATIGNQCEASPDLGAAFVVDNNERDKLSEKSKSNNLPRWFRKIPQTSGRTVASSRLAKQKDDSYPRKLNQKFMSQKERVSEPQKQDHLANSLATLTGLSKSERIMINRRGDHNHKFKKCTSSCLMNNLVFAHSKENSGFDYKINSVRSRANEQPRAAAAAGPTRQDENLNSKNLVKRKLIMKKLGGPVNQ